MPPKKKKPEKKKIPEAVAKRKAEGQAYIQRREKLASRAGISSKAAAEALVPQEQAITEGREAEAVEAAKVKGAEEIRAKGETFLEEKEFFEEEIPKKVGLDIEKETGFPGAVEAIPVVGPGVGALARAAAITLGDEKTFPTETLIQDPETLRELALQKIQKDVIKQGISRREVFGSLIESIPIVGSLAHKFASGLIEDPKGNVLTVLAEIDSERERASVIAEKAFTGKLGDPYMAYEQISEIEGNIARMEMRIKLLANTSAALRADADTLNRIEEKILRSKERVFIAKQVAAGGIIQPSSDASLYLELQELKGRKK